MGGTLFKSVVVTVGEPLAVDRHWYLTLEIVPSQPINELRVRAEYTGNLGQQRPFETEVLRGTLDAWPKPAKIKLGYSYKAKIHITRMAGGNVEYEMGDAVFPEIDVVDKG